MMDVFEARSELRKIGRRHLLELVSAQRVSKCLIGGRACGLYLHYKGLNFCISEIMGGGCQVEKERQWEYCYQDLQIDYPLLLKEGHGTSPLQKEKRKVVFRVYCRDCITRSMILLGKVIEKRTRERGNNLNDLLIKAIKDYSNCTADPSTIFLLSP